VKFIESRLIGCKLIEASIFHDKRGTFQKIYHENEFQNNGSSMLFREQYFTSSGKGVLRGMHFQLPPHDHCKLITCLTGSVLDVILDLRKDSKTYGQTDSFILSADSGKAVFLPVGFAHGFLSLEENSGMLYNTSTVYNPSSDRGIMWNSFDYNWPIKEPNLSDRDDNHIHFNQFKSPF